MKEFRIAAIPGDGIGKQVIPAGIQVLKVICDAIRKTYEKA